MKRGLDFTSETSKVITAKGVKPIAPVQWLRDNFWIYGVVEPLNGWHFEQEYPHLKARAFSELFGCPLTIVRQ